MRKRGTETDEDLERWKIQLWTYVSDQLPAKHGKVYPWFKTEHVYNNAEAAEAAAVANAKAYVKADDSDEDDEKAGDLGAGLRTADED